MTTQSQSTHNTENHVVSQTHRIEGGVVSIFGPYSLQHAKELCLRLREEELEERPMMFYYNVHRLER